MANNITTGGLTFLTVVSNRTIRLIGNVLTGEIDGRSIFNDATRIASIYVRRGDSYQTFKPNNNFSQVKALNPGEGVAIGANIAFESEFFFPLPNSAQQAQVLTAISQIQVPPSLQDTLKAKLPNLPNSELTEVYQAVQAAATANGYLPSDVIDSLGFLRSWWQADPASADASYGNRVGAIASWGSSTDTLSQTSEVYKPYLTGEGIEFSINPQTWLTYNGAFLANTNFTITLAERREALNAGWILGGSSSGNNANLSIGYSSPTTMSFNRIGGSDLSYTVPAALSADYRVWAFVFDGTKRYIYLNGVKVAEVADTIALGSYPDSSLGFNYSASYIGKVKALAISVATLNATRIAHISKFFSSYITLFPPIFGDAPSGSIAVTDPLSNSSFAINDNGKAIFFIRGNFTLDEESGVLSGLEARFPDSGSWRTIESRPPGPDFLIQYEAAAATGNLTVRFVGNPDVAAVVSNIAVIDAKVSNLQTSVSGKIITVTWTPPNASVASYVAGYSRDNGVTWTDENDSNAAGTSHAFPPLIGGSYLIRVKAILTTGGGDFKVTATPAEILPTPPAQIASNLVSASKSLLRFDDTANLMTDIKTYASLTTVGTLATVAGLSEGSTNALVLDAANGNYLKETDGTKFRLSNDHTIIFVFKYTGTYTSTTIDNTILAKWEEASTNRSYIIGVRSNTSGDQVLLRNSDGSTNNASSTPFVNTTAGTRNRPVLGIVQFSRTQGFFRAKIINPDRNYIDNNWSSVGLGGVKSTSLPATIGTSNITTAPGKYRATGQLDFLAFLDRLTDDEEGNYLNNLINGVPLFKQV